MWKRIIWDIVCLGMAFFAPWWATLVFGIIGVIAFSWYIEIIFLGVWYDAVFGGVTGAWYYHFIHTTIFLIPLCIAEFIKTRINIK